MALDPTPSELELHSPTVGPWFMANGGAALPDVLALPSTGKLAINLTQGGATTINGVSWLPPASGSLSFYLATPERPGKLALLRDVNHDPAFDDGSFVALFTLLPWVERRLDALTTTNVPSVAAVTTPGSASRPIVRYFAMELTSPPTSVGDIENLLWDDFVFPAGVSSDEDKAANLGLTWDGAALGNGDRPMMDLLQPGQFFPGTNLYQELLQFRSPTAVRLWSFDHRGRPLDAGAVASWWNDIASRVHPNMWGARPFATRTAPVAAGLVFHLVNAHEGRFVDTVPSRLVLTNNTGAGNLQTASNTVGVTVGFTAAPAVDDLPQPLAAVLPDGVYAAPAAATSNAVVAWPAGPVNNNINRDFARIAIMSAEHVLVGQPRVAPTGALDPAVRRAGDQDRTSTRVFAGRAARTDPAAANPLAATPALLAGTDAVLGALAVPPAGPAASTVVASIADRDAGPLVTTLAAGAVPALPPPLTLVALDGGGVADGVEPNATAIGQRVLLTATVGTAFTGAWMRVWPLGFDHRTAEHIRLDGGAAPVDADGNARMVVALPDGTVSAADPPRLGFDVMFVTNTAQVSFTDQRAQRPMPATAIDRIDVATVASGLLVVSTGVVHPGALPAGSVPSGSEVVAVDETPPQLIDRATIPAAAFGAGTLINLVTAADTIQLTEPAFATQSDDEYATGDAVTGTATPPVGTLSETGAAVTETSRQPFVANGFWTAGYPYPGCERLEVVVSHPPPTPAAAPFIGAAVVGSTPLLGAFHELPRHDQGHPSCPAAPEVHGNGVMVTGTASINVAEYVRDRTFRTTVDPVNNIDLVTAAATAVIADPVAPTANSLWMATLRTEAAGMAGDLAWDVLNNVAGNPFPFDGTWEAAMDFLFGTGGGTPIPANGASSARRALDRRVLASTYGACEGATAMLAAIGRAEDFIYIETPAFDHLGFGRTDDEIALWQALMDRMDAVPALHVAVCTPFRLLPGAPEPLQRIRDQAMLDAVAAMSSGTRAGRFVVFSPAAGPARSVRVASTTVIVDDVSAIVGTTHLWRRGLSFDSSLAVSVIDEQIARGRSAVVLAFRSALMAAQLNIPAAQLPLDPNDTIATIRALVERGGRGHLAAERLRPADPSITTAVGSFDEMDIWNPDGAFPGGDPLAWVVGLQQAVYDDTFNP